MDGQVLARILENGEVWAESSESILVLPPVDLAVLPQDMDWIGSVPGWLDKVRTVEHPDTSGPADSHQVIVAAIPASLTHDDWENLLQAVKAAGV